MGMPGGARPVSRGEWRCAHLGGLGSEFRGALNAMSGLRLLDIPGWAGRHDIAVRLPSDFEERRQMRLSLPRWTRTVECLFVADTAKHIDQFHRAGNR